MTDKGSMLWRMAYRYGGKQKTLSLGAYPTITLSQARLLREQAKQKLAQDEDPGAWKQESKAKPLAQAQCQALCITAAMLVLRFRKNSPQSFALRGFENR